MRLILLINILLDIVFLQIHGKILCTELPSCNEFKIILCTVKAIQRLFTTLKFSYPFPAPFSEKLHKVISINKFIFPQVTEAMKDVQCFQTLSFPKLVNNYDAYFIISLKHSIKASAKSFTYSNLPFLEVWIITSLAT